MAGTYTRHPMYHKVRLISLSKYPHRIDTRAIVQSWYLFCYNMTAVRKAQSSDFNAIVDVLAASFRHESYVSFLHPKPPADDELFHRDLVRYWRKQLRSKWYDDAHYFMVSRDEEGAIAGAAVWKEPDRPQRSLVQKRMKRQYFDSPRKTERSS